MFSTDTAIIGVTTVSNNVTLINFLNTFDLWLVESTDVELTDTEGQLYKKSLILLPSEVEPNFSPLCVGCA